MRSRIAAWLVTGPVGHGWAGVADAATVLLAVARQRRKGRRPRRHTGRTKGEGLPAPRP